MELKPSSSEKAFTYLSGIFLGSILLTNMIAGKFFVLFNQELSCGIIAYPITFLITDLISELYGKARANLLVKAGFLLSIFATGIIYLAGIVPIWQGSPVDESSFQTVFGLLPGIVFGSMLAYLSAQFIDVKIYHWIKEKSNGKHLWLRNNVSTIFSQLLDTTTVVIIALIVWPSLDQNEFTEPISWSSAYSIIIGQYLFKAAIAALDTPLIYVCVAFFKRKGWQITGT